jgi:fatty acid desaturase
MDEIVYRHGRIDRQRLAGLNERSDARGLRHLAGHGAALAVTAAILSHAIGSWWAVPATLLHGAALIFLFAPLHETIHRTAFRSRWLNDAVAAVCGALLVLPPDYFRYFHFAHHRYTQDCDNDPELASPKPSSRAAWLIHVSGWNYWRAQVGGALAHALGRAPERFLTAGSRRRVIREARRLLAA